MGKYIPAFTSWLNFFKLSKISHIVLSREMFSDREEGEIDSEEDSLRKRISELEAENAEYEKMRISEGYKNDCCNDLYTCESFNAWELQRAGQVPTDASSISSAEFPSPKKRRRKRFKKESSKVHPKHLENNYHCYHEPREKRHKYGRSDCKKPAAPRRILNKNKNVIETILLDSSDSNDYAKDNCSIATMNLDSEEDDENIVLPLSREELRLALVRNTNDTIKKNMCPLKERLRKEKENVNSIDKNQCKYSTGDKVNNSVKVVPEITDSSMSMEEQELRLIALRSAIMKKHLTRKKRNAEVAYSPTDFEQFVIDPLKSVETDLEELEKELDISPVSSPNLSLSPIHCEDDRISIVSLDSLVNQVDNRPIDMDIATSESENEMHPLNTINNENIFLRHSDIPLPHEPNLNGANIPMVYANHSTPIPFEMCMSEGKFKSQVELPLSLLPPRLSTTSLRISVSSKKDFSAARETTGVIHLLDDKLKKVDLISSALSATELTQNVQASQKSQSEADQVSDEEEKALRALLLSQRQNMKSSKQIINTTHQTIKNSPHLKPNELQKSIHIQQSFNDTGKSNPSESILKEAVRRLKVKTVTTDNRNLREELTYNSKYSQSVSVRNSLEPKIKDYLYNNENKFLKRQDKNIGLNENKINSDKQNIKECHHNNLEQRENTDLQLTTCAKKVDTSKELKEIKNDQQIRNVEQEEKVKVSNVKEQSKSETAMNFIKNEELEKSSNISILKPKITNVKTKTETNTKLPKFQKETTSAKNVPNNVNLLKMAKHITRPVKIIKPNKVINTSVGLKRKVILSNNAFLKTSDLLGSKSKTITTSRVISSANIPDIKVNKLVISLNDSESSNDEEFLRNLRIEKNIYKASERTNTPEPLVTVLNENFYKIPNANNASTESNNEQRKEINQICITHKKELEFSDSFEKKLEIYLKTVRSTVQQKNTFDRPKFQRISSSNEATPTAVRSLPIASQEEYKRLIHRMKLLEKQKQLKKLHKGSSTSTGILSESSPKNEMSKTTSSESIMDPFIEGVFFDVKKSSTTDQASMERQLEAYEASFINIRHALLNFYFLFRYDELLFLFRSNCVISNLNKSLRLVAEAKRAKIAKMRCVQRLKELRLEIDNTQCKLKEEQEKISRIYPEICSTNEIITKLNQKNAYVFESAVKLGKSVKGNDYRLSNDFKREITVKTRGLATDIKLVNSIKSCDLDLLEKETKITNESNWDSYKCDQVSNREYPEVINSVIDTEDVKYNCTKKIARNSKSENSATMSEKEIDNTHDTLLLSERVIPENHKEILDSQNKNADETPVDSSHRNTKVKEGSIDQKVFIYKENSDAFEGKGSLCKYVSPLMHLKTESGRWDPNGIICPYELMGQCEDKDCSYLHLCEKNSS